MQKHRYYYTDSNEVYTMSSDPIPIIAEMNFVRDLVQGITQTEYSDEKVSSSLSYGSAEVCLQTNKFNWTTADRQWHRARTAANYFAASDLLPKTIADQDSGMPLYMTYIKIATGICERINQGLPNDVDTSMIIVKSTRARNYYTNPNAEPFMVNQGYGGDTYHNSTNGIWYKTHESEVE